MDVPTLYLTGLVDLQIFCQNDPKLGLWGGGVSDIFFQKKNGKGGEKSINLTNFGAHFLKKNSVLCDGSAGPLAPTLPSQVFAS